MELPRTPSVPRLPARRPSGRAAATLALAALASSVPLATLGAVPASAHVVVTKDGKTLEGRIVASDEARIVVETTFDGTKEVARADVKSVDDRVPPLRAQLAFRLGDAGKDPKGLAEVAAWAKAKGFKAEVDDVWQKVLEVDPANVKAHKALGHVKVGDRWMTTEEKAGADKAAEEAALRAKGLVPYQGRWVTPQEKEALEKGLLKDGDEWVTEEVFHRRRGERLVEGKWIRVGEKEGVARAAALSKALEVNVVPLWGPHVDVFHELKAEDGKAVLEAAEKAWDAFAGLLKPGEKEGLEGLRVEVVCFEKPPAYARYAELWSKENDIGSMPGFENWASQVRRQPGFWWTSPKSGSGHYLFPNTVKALQSGVAHNLSLIWLNRYRFNLAFSAAWLQDGLAYVVEQKGLGYSQTYTVDKGSSAGSEIAEWQDSAKWKEKLKAAVAASQDTPAYRLLALGPQQATVPELVKVWSLVDFLVRLDGAKFKAFVDASKVRGRTEEDALRDVYGLDARALETKWRAWVQGGFTSP